MKITKYEHSCLDIEQDGKRFLIDPGTVTHSVPNYDNVIAVLVTHVHMDHLDAEKLSAIHAQNPATPIYTVQAVADELKDKVPVTVVTGGQKASAGPFELEFVGGQHALIHKIVPVTDNVGVIVNGKLYYPGDSLSLPETNVDIVAVPITAPWLKISEAMDFITSLKPKQVFPVHDALLSEFGLRVNESWLKMSVDKIGSSYTYLKTGESLTV